MKLRFSKRLLRFTKRVAKPVGRARGAKAVVAFPAGGSVTVPFHTSMVRMLAYEMEKKREDRLIGQMTYTSGLYIADNRNVLAERFLKSECDWLLQVDTDIEFPPTLLELMLGLADMNGCKILAASVPLGTAVICGDEGGYRHGYPTCAFDMVPGRPGFWESRAVVPSTPVECDGVATAVMLAHRTVFEDVAKRSGMRNWFDHIYIKIPNDRGEPCDRLSQGEDLAFCIRAKDAGHAVWCVHVPGLRHHKTSPQTHDTEAMRSTTEDLVIGAPMVGALAGG